MKKQNLLLVLILLLTSLFSNPLWATKIKYFGLNVDYPTSGIPIGETAYLKVKSYANDSWGLGTLTIKASSVLSLSSSVPYNMTDSNAENVLIKKIIPLTKEIDQGVISIPIVVIQDGEYEINIIRRRTSHQQEVTRTETLSIFTKNGISWFGTNSILDAIENKIRYELELDGMLSSQEVTEKLEEKLKIEDDKRVAFIRKIIQGNAISAKSAKKIKKGDILVVNASWNAPIKKNKSLQKPIYTSQNGAFPMHGVKIIISDQITSNKSLITGYMANGKFSFKAPRDDYQYKVVMESEFSGIKKDGNINLKGSGIGWFQVVEKTATGKKYICEGINKLIINCSSSAWAAFHGMAEMVLQANTQLGVEKKSAFKVIFEVDPKTSTSSYISSTGDIKILFKDRYDWDVVAHEFSHAISEETKSVSGMGGDHTGENQFDVPKCTKIIIDDCNSSTHKNKEHSLSLAMNEGFGTWFGIALLENTSSAYKGKFKNIGDGEYNDTEDATIKDSLEDNKKSPAYGEDAEKSLYLLMWDIMDSHVDVNQRATYKDCKKCTDSINLNLKSLWKAMQGSKITSVIDLYHKILEKQYKIKFSELLLFGNDKISATGLQGVLNLSYSFAEFGVAPFLKSPTKKIKLDLLKDKSSEKFEWSQEKTGTLEGLTTFTLAIYTFDKKTLVFKKTGITTKNYTLTESDIKSLKIRVDALSQPPSSLIATVIGKNTHSSGVNSGPYMSNPVEIIISNVDRVVVVIVDSSGSNQSTDPKNLRIDAAKKTLESLTSLSESKKNSTVPDLAGAIDFDGSPKILSELADPDAVIKTLDAIDSDGSTDVPSGIYAGIKLLENLNISGFSGVILNKSALAIFTDEADKSSQPVINAIVTATLKGIRVHYGFLSPFTKQASNITATSLYEPISNVVPKMIPIKDTASLPKTIQEAVIASGGVYAVIGDAESQVAFVKQIESKGFTHADNSITGHQEVVGQTKTFDLFNDPLGTKSFGFNGLEKESVTLILDTEGNFHPFVRVKDKDGKIIAIHNDENGDGVISLNFILPYSGQYHAEVTSQDNRSGLFSIFIDVENQPDNQPQPETIKPIPTLSEWGIIFLILMLFSIAYTKRRKI